MKTERWYQRLTRHGLPGLALRTLLIYVVTTLLALALVLSIATPDTYRQMELIYGLAMLAVTIALTAWLVTYYVAQAQHSEARYRQLVEQVADGIFVCSRTGKFQDVNTAGCAMLGYTRAELLQRKISDVIDPDDLAASPLQLDRPGHGQAVSSVHRLQPKAGPSLTVEINARQIEADRIIAIVRDVTSITRREREWAAAAGLAAELRAAASQAEALPLIVQYVRQRLETQAVALGIINPFTEEIVLKAAHGAWEPYLDSSLPLSEGGAAEILRSGSIYASNSLDDDPHIKRHEMLQSVRALLAVPLVTESGPLGILAAGRSTPFTEEDSRLLSMLAGTAAIAIQNARLFEAERKQLRLAQTLQAVGALLTAGMSLDEVFNYLFDFLARVVRYDSVSIQLLSDNQIVFAAGRGFSDVRRAHEIVRGAPLSSMEERWGQPHQRVMIVPDTEHDPRWVTLPGSEPIRSWVGAALRVKGRLLGVLNVDSFTPNTYNEATGETVAAFANQAAIAIENAQLHDSVRRHAEELEDRIADRTLELERERRRTAAILDAAGEGIMFTNLKGAIEYMNAAMERLTGFTASEALGQNSRLWQSGTTPVSFYQKMWQTISRGGIWQGELVNRRKDGALYDAALTIAPVFDINGEIGGYVGVQRDISNQKELDRLKDEFVSNVSHELRTPIANVKLYISLLTRGKPEKHDEYLQTLRREAARLEKLIEDLLDLSRLDLGRQPIRLAAIDVNLLAAQLIADRTALAAGRQLLIDYRAESGPALAQADPAMLGQVVSNLLTNAVNYTPAGGLITVITAARQRDEQNWITITIQDTGPGISPHDRDHLFERFYRGEAGRKSGAPGTGLGLAISAQIMNKLGGAITLDSRPGEGAAFTVWLKPAA